MLLTTRRYYVRFFGLAGVASRTDALGPYIQSKPKQTVWNIRRAGSIFLFYIEPLNITKVMQINYLGRLPKYVKHKGQKMALSNHFKG